jgi:CheY-like chemotaxis protein
MFGTHLTGTRALVVEDDDDAREIMATVLRSSGAEVWTASNVVEAIRAMRTVRPNAIVTDLAMPKGTGIDVLSACREILGPSVPCVLVTAFVGNETQAGELGFDGYLEKPFRPADLVNALTKGPAKAGPTDHPVPTSGVRVKQQPAQKRRPRKAR